MFYVTKELIKQLSPEDQDLVMENGIPMDEMEAMSPEEKSKLMGADESDVKAPTTEESDDDLPTAPEEKVSDESKLAKPTKYGDEDQFESNLTEDGRLEELPNSKKNAIGSFDDAADQGMALLDKLAKTPAKKPMPKKKKEINQEELDGQTDE